jgi:hypothetical protein
MIGCILYAYDSDIRNVHRSKELFERSFQHREQLPVDIQYRFSFLYLELLVLTYDEEIQDSTFTTMTATIERCFEQIGAQREPAASADDELNPAVMLQHECDLTVVSATCLALLCVPRLFYARMGYSDAALMEYTTKVLELLGLMDRSLRAIHNCSMKTGAGVFSLFLFHFIYRTNAVLFRLIAERTFAENITIAIQSVHTSTYDLLDALATRFVLADDLLRLKEENTRQYVSDTSLVVLDDRSSHVQDASVRERDEKYAIILAGLEQTDESALILL